ncbi:MAG TPA: hypothetical protein DHN33_00940 [Eubacteriaceae bacterium]|nr:hypothetical protein [Eubacteriaceae bacterium]
MPLNKRAFFVFLFLLLLVAFTACSNDNEPEDVSSQQNQKILRLENTIRTLEERVRSLEEENESTEKILDEYKRFIPELLDYLDEEEQLEMAHAQWSYSFQADGLPLSAQGNLLVEEDTFSFTITEEENEVQLLPNALHQKGKLTGSLFSNHLQFLNRVPDETFGSDENGSSSATYVFNNLSGGDEIIIELSEELTERLDLQTQTITVTVDASVETGEDESTFFPFQQQEDTAEDELDRHNQPESAQ